MAKRFGRNQRRAQRRQLAETAATLAEAEAALRRATAEAADLRFRLERHRAEGLLAIVGQRGAIEAAVSEIVERLGQDLGERLRPAAEEIFASSGMVSRDRVPEPPLEFTADARPDRKAVTLCGRIPEIRWCVLVELD